MLHVLLDSVIILETQWHLDEIWRGRIDLFTSGTTKASFVRHFSNCAQSIIDWDLSVFLDYQDDVRTYIWENAPQIYGWIVSIRKKVGVEFCTYFFLVINSATPF